MASLVTKIDDAALATTYSSSEDEEESLEQEGAVTVPNELVLTVDSHDEDSNSCTLGTSTKKRKHDRLGMKNRCDKKHVKKSSRGQKNMFAEVVDVCSGNSSGDSLSSGESKDDLDVEDDLEDREWRRKREERSKNLTISPKLNAAEDSLSDDDVEVELQPCPVQALHSTQRQDQAAAEDNIFAASAMEDARKAAEEVNITVAFSKREEVRDFARDFALHGNAKFQKLHDMIVSSLNYKPEDFALRFEGKVVSLDRTIDDFMKDEEIEERDFQLDA